MRDSVRTFARAHGVRAIARDESGTAWRKLWPALAELGMFGAAVPSDMGGAGGTFADLAVMLHQAGEELIPGPLVAAAISAVLCSADSVSAASRHAIIAGAPASGINSAIAWRRRESRR
jgi:hypothetical protein